jgi:hypothetical protein
MPLVVVIILTICVVSSFLLAIDVEASSFEQACGAANSPVPGWSSELCSFWQRRHRMVDAKIVIEWFRPRHMKHVLAFLICSRFLQFGNSWNLLHIANAWPPLAIKHLIFLVVFIVFTETSLRLPDFLSLSCQWLI